MFLPLVSALISFGELHRFTDIILMSTSSAVLSTLRRSPISKYGQISFVALNREEPDRLLDRLNFKTSPHLICFQVNSSTEVQGLKEAAWFLEGVNSASKSSDTNSSSGREYYWHTLCLAVLWPRSPFNLTQEGLQGMLRNKKIPKSYQLDSCVYFWFLDTGQIYEVYYLKQRLSVRRVDQVKALTSALGRRKDFGMEDILAGHVKNWEITSANAQHTLSLNPSNTYHFLGYMQDYLNFTVVFIRNDEWSAMSEKVKSGKVDIGISATGMLMSSVKDFRFLATPTYTEHLSAYFNLPDDTNSKTTFVHVKPFSRETWLVTFVVLGLLLLAHYVMSRELSDAWWYALSCLTMRGYSLGIGNSIRMVTFIGSVLFVILYALYSGELISSLSTKKEKVYKLDDLIGLGFTFGITNGSYLNAAKEYGDLGHDSQSLSTRIFSHLHRKMGRSSIDNAIRFIVRGTERNYAFLTEEYVFDRLVKLSQPEGNDTTCSLFRDIPIPEYTVQQTPIMRRDSPLVDHFNLARIRMRETGLWKLQSRRQDVKTAHLKPQCSRTQITSFDIYDVLLPLCIIVWGFMSSSFCFIFELIVSCNSEKGASNSQGCGICK